MAVDDFADIPARPKIHLSCRARTSARLVPWYLWCFAQRGIGLDCFHEALDDPSVVRREKHVQEVCRSNWLYLVSEIPFGNFYKLREQDVGRGLAARLRGVVAGQVAR